MKIIPGVKDPKTKTDSLRLGNPVFTIYKSQVEYMSLLARPMDLKWFLKKNWRHVNS